MLRISNPVATMRLQLHGDGDAPMGVKMLGYGWLL